MKKTLLLTAVATTAFFGAAHGISLNFVDAPGDVANGQLYVPFSTATSVLFTDIGGQGFDLRISQSNFIGAGQIGSFNNVGPFPSVLATNGNQNTINFEFFVSGTSQSVRQVVEGIEFRFEDVDVSNVISNFTTYSVNGVSTVQDFTNASIFTPDAGMTVTTTEFYYPGEDFTLSAGRGMSADLTSNQISGFSFDRFGGDSFMAFGLGDVTPIPFNPSPFLGLGLVGGFFAWRVRRAKKATAEQPQAQAV